LTKKEIGMSDRTELKVGDVVSLRSKGPLMTVTGVDPIGGDFGLAWFSDSGACLRETLPAAALVLEVAKS
jgi:uncharacterized protein YodC (DUF2158 family)